MEKPPNISAWLKIIPKNAREEIRASIVSVSGDDMLQLLVFRQNGKGGVKPMHARCLRFRPDAIPHLREAVTMAESMIGRR